MPIPTSLPRPPFGKTYVTSLTNPTGRKTQTTQRQTTRLPRLNEVFGVIEDWTMTKTKYEVMEICNPLNIPVGPILSMKEIADEPSLRATGTIVECDHPERGPYLSVGCPVKLSDNTVTVTRSPLLGESY